ncbi:hypothetical protein BTZ20_4909 [Rhodococcus sp. MTM3W5.2]|nr:hypothetical protein BTZ20_4909 [Rhodococcus sp. MTM3W5.2]
MSGSLTGLPRDRLIGPRHPARVPELNPCSVIPSAEYIRARMFSSPI